MGSAQVLALGQGFPVVAAVDAAAVEAILAALLHMGLVSADQAWK